MAIIKCPECGENVSDRASVCIHCGYPLQSENTKYYDLIYNGFRSKKEQESNLSVVAVKMTSLLNGSHLDRMIFLSKSNQPFLSGLTEKNAHTIQSHFGRFGCIFDLIETDSANVDNNKIVENKFMESDLSADDAVVMCPRCKSTAITTGARGYSIWTGFLGSGKTVNRCAKCGHTWEPK